MGIVEREKGMNDDQMLNKANNVSLQLRIRVENPLAWLQEVTEDEQTEPDSESDS